MQFNVSSLLKESTGAWRVYEIDDDVRIDGVRRHVSGHARFDRTHDGVLARAQVTGADSSECSRCLKQLTFPVTVVFEEEYIPVIDVNSGMRVDPPEGDEEAYRINSRHILDLTEAVQQYWAMAAPMAPVCDDECVPRCPACTSLIVSDEHTCERGGTDARWAKLANLELSQ